MKHEIGDMFIIRIGEVYYPDNEEEHTLYRIKGFNSLVFDDEGLNRLEPINSNEMFTQKAMDEQKECSFNQGRYQGIADAWNLAKVIANYPDDERREVFNDPSAPATIHRILANHTYYEAKNAINDYNHKPIDGKYVCINAADFLNLFTVGKVYTVSNGSITTDTTGDAGYVISKKELQNSFVRLME